MDERRDEQLGEDDLQDDTLVEEAPEEIKDPVSADEQTLEPGNMADESEPAQEEQLEKQIASAGLKVHTEEEPKPRASSQSDVDNAEPVSDGGPLFKNSQVEGLRSQWFDIQSGFVDNPHGSVEAADQLLQKSMDTIRAQLATRRASIESQWHQENEDVTTEELRRTLQQYRSLLERILEMQI